ncbi:hypothetical protein B0H14DRAFT_3043653 [Mycena olivaceomarginata]|nr:hypothetical protein B0H14DRAFT_3043653 [Mycena olivaceomarginata]
MRTRAGIACIHCRGRKVKCLAQPMQAEGSQPCGRCTKMGLSCVYLSGNPQDSQGIFSRSGGKPRRHEISTPPPSHDLPLLSSSTIFSSYYSASPISAADSVANSHGSHMPQSTPALPLKRNDMHLQDVPPQKPTARKRRKCTRSTTGCLTCRVKKIKAKPTCMQCTERQRDCRWPEGTPQRQRAPYRFEDILLPKIEVAQEP